MRQAGYSTPVITAGRIPTPELAEEILRTEQADIIALARPVLRDPEWPRKAREGRASDIYHCVYCNQCLERVIMKDLPAQCKNACSPACPAGIDIPRYIRFIANGWPAEAVAVPGTTPA